MDLDEVLYMDQTTIGPDELSMFITAVDELAARCPREPSRELAHATTGLNAALSIWDSGRVRQSMQDPASAPAVAAKPASVADDCAAEVAVIHNIIRHLERLVLRHSNFGFAAHNLPSALDSAFPETALKDVRIALPRLRAAARALPATR